jgi:hypothetical protein
MTHHTVTVEKYNPEVHLHLAKQICDAQREENPQMLPLTPEIMAGHQYGAIAHIASIDAVGYNAITELYETPPTLEIGGLYIMKSYRGQGMFDLLKAHIYPVLVGLFPDTPAVIFANDKSAPKNMAHGAQPITHEQLPTGALDNCATCPKVNFLINGQVCCDTLLYFSKEKLAKLGDIS